MNLLLCTDVYKMGHMEQYPEGTQKVYSYLCARSNRKFKKMVFFGLQYYLKKYLSEKITNDNVVEFCVYYRSILKREVPMDVRHKLFSLADLGYIPLKIRAVQEGTLIEPGHVLMTVENTIPEFYWVVGFFESLLLKVWNTCTVATNSYELHKECMKYSQLTCDDDTHVPYQVHDFGYRGCSSEETAALSGAAHLVVFEGTDTVPAVKLIQDYYTQDTMVGASVPASEHSVMCAYGRENEFQAFESMLDLYPSGIVSIVSDSYDLWNVLDNFTVRLKDRILAREGKVVFRPDSGDPYEIVCGEPGAEYVNFTTCYDLDEAKEYAADYLREMIDYERRHGERGALQAECYFLFEEKFYLIKVSVWYGRHDKQYYYIHEVVVESCVECDLPRGKKGAIEILGDVFGYEINSKGYKVLNPKVGLIYGDGIYPEMMLRILKGLESKGWASSNIVFGVGGLLLQQHSRDDLGFTMKCSYIIDKDGNQVNIIKDPITDPGKKSLTGGLVLVAHYDMETPAVAYETFSGLSEKQVNDIYLSAPPDGGAAMLERVFVDRAVLPMTFAGVRKTLSYFRGEEYTD